MPVSNSFCKKTHPEKIQTCSSGFPRNVDNPTPVESTENGATGNSLMNKKQLSQVDVLPCECLSPMFLLIFYCRSISISEYFEMARASLGKTNPQIQKRNKTLQVPRRLKALRSKCKSSKSMAKALSRNIASSFSTSMDPVPAFEMKTEHLWIVWMWMACLEGILWKKLKMSDWNLNVFIGSSILSNLVQNHFWNLLLEDFVWFF